MRGSEDVRAPVASEEPRSGCSAVGMGSNIKKRNRTGRFALVLTGGCWNLRANCRAEDMAVSLACSASLLQVAWSATESAELAVSAGRTRLEARPRHGDMELRPWLQAPAA